MKSNNIKTNQNLLNPVEFGILVIKKTCKEQFLQILKLFKVEVQPFKMHCKTTFFLQTGSFTLAFYSHLYCKLKHLLFFSMLSIYLFHDYMYFI